MRNHLIRSVALLACATVFVGLPPARAQQLPNADFSQGTNSPQGWTLSGGQGRWVDRQILEVTGTGKGSNQWQTDAYRFIPGGLYRFQMRARRTSGSGCVISGPAFANRDHYDLGASWRWYGHVFRAPDLVDSHIIRLGQWEAAGTVQFDAVRLTPVIPVYRAVHGMLLGEGESIEAGRYVFRGSFGHPGSNFHRTLLSATAGFNSDRWCFSGNQQVTYRFCLPGRPMRSGRVSFHVNHFTRGTCLAELSRDQQHWVAVATKNGLGTAEAAIPGELLPAELLFVRLRTASLQSYFQVNQVEFQAALAGHVPDAQGRTLFAELPSAEAARAIESITLEESPASGSAVLRVAVRNQDSVARPARAEITIITPRGAAIAHPAQSKQVPAGGTASFDLPIEAQEPGEHRIELCLEVPGTPPFKSLLGHSVPDYYRADYGERIEGLSQGPAVWWCEAAHKVPRQRPVPGRLAPAARLSAARGDYEACQIVVRPSTPLKGLTATAAALTGPGGAAIPASNVKVLRVYYHYVEHPTDQTGVRDWWPDALPPLEKPLDVPAALNQPLWVLVRVPKDAKAGDYQGLVALRAEGWSAQVPLRLHVWDFALPDRNHLETAFGFSPGVAFRYHQVKTESDKRKVLEMYLQSFAEHRISPYDPVPLDPIRVRFLPDADPPRAEVDFSAFDQAMSRAIEKYHFTNFMIHLQGMGGGTFHERYEPRIGKYGEHTPQYQAAFASYVKQLEEHLRQKGWLGMAYTYWFDEPEPRDYDFVRNGMERLRRYAPGIRRMLTEEPVDALVGAVDIWCPVSPNYDHAKAEKRRAAGERIWWYVCCGPKAPYCTLFIDHPATELRIWLWQTWQRKIAGILIWSANYWTSSAAYPDKPQNPYLDPMGYVSGYSTPPGTKRYWGNGDGRFIYPPERAAEPGLSGKEPVLDPPVSSIRWEMLREGIEDFEYLCLLRELIASRRGNLAAEQLARYETLLEVPAEITKDMTTFTTHPAPIYARRAQIAEAIEQLMRQR